jgi:hypothetical protein
LLHARQFLTIVDRAVSTPLVSNSNLHVSYIVNMTMSEIIEYLTAPYFEYCHHEGSDEFVGKYVQAASSLLSYSGWNELHQAFEYAPSESSASGYIQFPYTRKAFIGTVTPDSVFGSDKSPKIRVCPPGQPPWPERFNPKTRNPVWSARIELITGCTHVFLFSHHRRLDDQPSIRM